MSSSGVPNSPLIADLPALDGAAAAARFDLEAPPPVDADGLARSPVDRDASPTQEVARAEEVVERIKTGVAPRVVATFDSREEHRQDRRALSLDAVGGSQ